MPCISLPYRPWNRGVLVRINFTHALVFKGRLDIILFLKYYYGGVCFLLRESLSFHIPAYIPRRSKNRLKGFIQHISAESLDPRRSVVNISRDQWVRNHCTNRQSKCCSSTVKVRSVFSVTWRAGIEAKAWKIGPQYSTVRGSHLVQRWESFV